MKNIGDILALIVCAIIAFTLSGLFIWDITHGGGYDITATNWAR